MKADLQHEKRKMNWPTGFQLPESYLQFHHHQGLQEMKHYNKQVRPSMHIYFTWITHQGGSPLGIWLYDTSPVMWCDVRFSQTSASLSRYNKPSLIDSRKAFCFAIPRWLNNRYNMCFTQRAPACFSSAGTNRWTTSSRFPPETPPTCLENIFNHSLWYPSLWPDCYSAPRPIKASAMSTVLLPQLLFFFSYFSTSSFLFIRSGPRNKSYYNVNYKLN